MCNDMKILDMGYLLVKSGKFMKVRREKAESMDLGSNMSTKKTGQI